MDWYYCQDCGAVFSEEDLLVETVENRHWWLDDCPVERLTEYSCPECGSNDVEEAEYCDYCGDAFRPEDLTDGVCARCRNAEKDLEK